MLFMTIIIIIIIDKLLIMQCGIITNRISHLSVTKCLGAAIQSAQVDLLCSSEKSGTYIFSKKNIVPFFYVLVCEEYIYK